MLNTHLDGDKYNVMSFQVCAGHKSESEAAINAMREIFVENEADAALLIALHTSLTP